MHQAPAPSNGQGLALTNVDDVTRDQPNPRASKHQCRYGLRRRRTPPCHSAAMSFFSTIRGRQPAWTP